MSLTPDEQFRLEAEQGAQAYEQYHREAEEAAQQYATERKGVIREGSAKRQMSAGAFAGAVGGGAIGGAVSAGNPFVTAAGAIVGTVAGELGQQGVDIARGSAYAPHSLKDSAERVLDEVKATITGEVFGGAFQLIRPVRYAQPRQLTANQARFKSTLDQYGIPYTSDEITGDDFTGFLRNIAENGTLSQKKMKEWGEDRMGLIKDTARGLAGVIGQHVPPDVLGKRLLAEIQGDAATGIKGAQRQITEQIIEPYYNTIRQDLQYTTQTIQVPSGQMQPHPQGLINPNTGQVMQVPVMVDKIITQGGLLVDLRPLKAKYAQQVAELEKNAINRNDVGLKKLTAENPAYVSMKEFTQQVDFVQWNAAHDLLKNTRENIRRLDNPMDTVSSRIYDKGVLGGGEGVLEAQMEEALRTSGNPAHKQDLQLWRDAQAVVKQKNAVFRNEVTLRLVKALEEHGGDSNAFKTFVNQMSPDDASKVLDTAMYDPDLQNSIRRMYVEGKLNQAAGLRGESDPFDAAVFRKQMFGKDEFSNRKSSVILDPTTNSKIREFTDAVESIQKADANKGQAASRVVDAQAGRTILRIPKDIALAVSGGALAGTLGYTDTIGPLEAVGGAVASIEIVLAPRQLAGILTNQRKAEYLIQGLRYSISDRNNATRVIRELVRLDQGIAHAIRTQVSGSLVDASNGKPNQTAETVQKIMPVTVPSIFGNQQ